MRFRLGSRRALSILAIVLVFSPGVGSPETGLGPTDAYEVKIRSRMIKVPFSDYASKREAKARIEKAKTSLAAGADFAALARRLSARGESTNGGDFGFIWKGCGPAGSPLATMEQVAFSLRPGQVSDIFDCGNGYCLLKVEDKQPIGGGPIDVAEWRLNVSSTPPGANVYIWDCTMDGAKRVPLGKTPVSVLLASFTKRDRHTSEFEYKYTPGNVQGLSAYALSLSLGGFLDTASVAVFQYPWGHEAYDEQQWAEAARRCSGVIRLEGRLVSRDPLKLPDSETIRTQVVMKRRH